ncbi:MAG: PilW family protein [Gallionella sp.]
MKNRRDKSYLTKKLSGFILIEMMIALTVGLFILGAVSAVAINSGKNSRSNDRTSELQTNGRYALDVLRRDIQHAGQSGLTPSTGLYQSKVSGFFNIASGVAVTNDCATGFALMLEQPVTGSDNSNAYSGTCITNANYVGNTDVIAVRYADMSNLWPVLPATATTAPASAVANDIYFRSSYSISTIFQKGGVAPNQVGTGPMQDQLLKTYVYYISPNTNTCSSTNTSPADGIPALCRVGLSGGAMASELVASGIENLQVQYGIADASGNGNTQYCNASEINTGTCPSWTQWQQVQSVRVWLLARNSGSERSDAYLNKTTYPMGNVSFVPAVGTNDQYRRQLYMATIQMRN